MPSAMTMQRPHARVVRIELYDRVPCLIGMWVGRLHYMGISSGRVGEA